MKKILFLTLISLILASTATAQSFPKSVSLTRGRSYTVQANNCALSITRESTSQINFSCSGSSAGRRSYGPSSVTLARQGNFSLKANRCFLAVRSNSSRRIVVNCAANAPVPTPTPTATPTSEPTVTPTATPTVTPTATPTPIPNANLLLDTQEIRSFNVSNPTSVGAAVAVTGLTAGQVIVATDYRPVNGFLYGLGYNGLTGVVQLYRLSSLTGRAIPVGTTGTFVDGSSNPVRVGVDSSTTLSIDFNPTSDRLRVVSSNGQNFRINPNSGAFVDGDSGVAGTNMDGAISGSPGQIQQVAHSGNSAISVGTALYSLDAVSDKLAFFQSTNTGVQSEIASFNSQLTSVDGFDITDSVNGVQKAYTVATIGTSKSFFDLDLNEGIILPLANFNSISPKILSLSVYTPNSPPLLVFSESGTRVSVRQESGTSFDSFISGIAVGDAIVGSDYEAATGVLYALAINSSAETGTLYRVDPRTGSSTTIGSTGSIAFVDTVGTPVDLPAVATGYGVDFNPVTGALHVVTGNGLNFRINPTTGSGIDGNSGVAGTQMDPKLSGVATSLVGIAFTNSIPGTTLTTIYGINAVNNSLVILKSDNSGVTTNEVPIKFADGSALNFGNKSSLDIQTSVKTTTTDAPVASGIAYGVFNGGLYKVNLTTGIASFVIPASSTEALAVGASELD